MGNETRRLLQHVAQRLRVCRVARRFYVLVLVLSAVYAALLLACRLLGLIPDRFAPITLVAVLAAALALAVASYRRPRTAEAARRVDKRCGTEDLFLTTVLIETSAGRYAPLVVRSAEETADGCHAREVVPWSGLVQARNGTLALVVLLAGVLFLPQLDPFGRGQERERQAAQRRQLEDMRKATALRAAELKPKIGSALSDEVQKALEEMKLAFDATKPQQKEANLQRLAIPQAELAKLWREASEDRLRDAAPLANQLQRFGERKSPAADTWQQEMKQGRTDALRDEMEALKQMAEKIAETKDEAEKQALAQELKERMEQLKEFAANQCSSAPLDAALQRALAQMAMAGVESLSSEAMAGLKESLELTQMEMEALAENLRDLQALEEGLKAAQLAKRLNDMDMLDGGASGDLQEMADYAELYSQLMAGLCPACGDKLGGDGVCTGCGQTNRRGPGMGSRGIGEGGVAPEYPAAETDFQPEKSKSALTAGKVLLTMKVQGVADPGEAAVQYQQSMQQIRQGLSEAILHEQVPPAYHEAIRKYFDSLEEANGQAAGE